MSKCASCSKSIRGGVGSYPVTTFWDTYREHRHRNGDDRISKEDRVCTSCRIKINKPVVVHHSDLKSPTETVSMTSFEDVVTVAEGGQGVIKTGRLASTGVIYALKVMRTRVTGGITDVSLLRQLDHDLFPRFVAEFKFRRNTVVVMEFCDGGTLANYIYSLSKTFDRSRRYVCDLIRALEYVHRIGSHVHMDVKPENILLTTDGALKLTDFGCAIPITGPREVLERTNGGTKAYWPREVILKTGFDSTVDVFSMGCISFQLFVTPGDHPFYPVSWEDVTLALELMDEAEQTLERIRGYVRLPQCVKTFLLQALEKEREVRPTIGEMLAISQEVRFLLWECSSMK